MVRIKAMSEEEKLPRITITWTGDQMDHPKVELEGVWPPRLIKSMQAIINRGYTAHLQELRNQGVGANNTNEDQGE